LKNNDIIECDKEVTACFAKKVNKWIKLPLKSKTLLSMEKYYNEKSGATVRETVAVFLLKFILKSEKINKDLIGNFLDKVEKVK
jgi:hypothetical protein